MSKPLKTSKSLKMDPTHMASTTQRVVFSFDENSLNALNAVKKRGGFNSLGSAVRESIQLNEFLQDQAAKGFSEIVVRDPESHKEKTIMIPSLQRLAKDQVGK